MRATVVAIRCIAALMLAATVGCGPGGTALDAGMAPACHLTAIDASMPSCAPPLHVDPAAIDSWDAFLAAASGLACEASLRCAGDLPTPSPALDTEVRLAESFCHPKFARLQATRQGATVLPPFDSHAARACVDGLLAAQSCGETLRVALACLDLLRPVPPGGSCTSSADCSGGVCLGGPCHATCVQWRFVGESCSPGCAPGLACKSGACAPASHECERCVVDGDCGGAEQDQACVDGICYVGPALGEACASSDPLCAEGLACVSGMCVAPLAGGATCGSSITVPCGPGSYCEGSACTTLPRIGCPCASDAACPANVARCVAGACVARPMVGDACSATGPPCFGGTCDAGVCRLDAMGEACADNSDCASGLICRGRGAFGGTGTCVPPRLAGESCSDTPCGAGLVCAGGLCTTPGGDGADCSTIPCADGLMCGSSPATCVACPP